MLRSPCNSPTCARTHRSSGSFAKQLGQPVVSKTLGDRFSAPAVETRPSIWGECPPKFATKLGRVVVKDGQMGRFSCKITGRPQLQVTWLKVWTVLIDHLGEKQKPPIQTSGGR
ncbi:myosin light chain kinase, smooth muscle-like [Saimiri boliviensis]|uniref:myosin light chain kinase, smooth muscle-like n=1 Tax=Saimiri boliviensis TaxID=27679 RepID=UPI000533E6FA